MSKPSSSFESLRMLDYYCQHKTAKDIVIVFYHTVKQHENSSCVSTINQISSRFVSYFSRVDVNTLDREHREVLKATSSIIQKQKSMIGTRMEKEAESEELESDILTPKQSLRLEIHSAKYRVSKEDLANRDSDIFKTSWNQEPNTSSKVETYKYEKQESLKYVPSVNESLKATLGVTQVDALYSKLMEYYQWHKLDLAHATALKILKLSRQHPSSSLSAQRTTKIREIQAEHSQMINYYKEFEEPGWEFDNITNNISLHSKTINNGQHVAVLITAELPIPLINFLVMTQEIDLFSKFVPFCGQGDEIKRVARNLYIGRSTVDVPLLTNRETYFYAKMIDRLQTTGSIFFYSKSINNNLEICKKYGITIPPDSPYIKLEYNFCIVECKILSKDKIHIRMASSVDMKMNYLPNFILMMSARRFALQYFMNILKEQKKFDQSEWARRITEKETIYGYFQQVIERCLGEK